LLKVSYQSSQPAARFGFQLPWQALPIPPN